ncbi:MAG TPA: bifunctional phosphopantothenoylcysteine decarboxylase/phosphopantothenate--cysteine ligase CoaBC, partial [Actinomycetes bacterium]|nr:bifunctional phosphopantothenoylcysteine decarboxylase/phosphopantothenate--cysteine ligase CoaBC [Actinomycetes bacterium]
AGIAAYKAAELARELMRAGAEVQPLLTESGERMVSRATFAALTGRPVPASVWDDPAAVEHVALARWGQVLVVAPATAHTLARLAAGLADDLLTNVALAFGGPVVVAPAMHTEMWEHPATRANLATLEGRGVLVVPPASGPLTSGDVGPGRLAELEDLVAGVGAALTPTRTLAGTRVLVSLGGTREPLDPVRYLGNRSSGRMGAAIVAEALARGAEVTAVAAAATVDLPARARVIGVETAQQLYDAVLAEAGAQDVLIMAAAVADFRPKRVAEGKLKKEQGVPEVVLEATPDTLAELGRRRRPDQVLVGFAAETGDHLAGARRKLEAKHLDLVVLNHVEGAHSAFGADDADAYLVDATTVEELPRAAKAAIAARLLDRVEALRPARA